MFYFYWQLNEEKRKTKNVWKVFFVRWTFIGDDRCIIYSLLNGREKKHELTKKIHKNQIVALKDTKKSQTNSELIEKKREKNTHTHTKLLNAYTK